jgi:decaprenylphospho-beta-D-ribofuranose 2-oxidase
VIQADAAEPMLLTGWGRTAPSRASVHRPRSADELVRLLDSGAPRGAIARGLGRSYGDAAQNAGGRVLVTTAGMAGVRELDRDAGRVRVGAGTSLASLVRETVPAGWFLPVSPGTKHVTVGGAIAADIHGKNHHRDGGFCSHVESLALQTPAGELLQLQPGDEAFDATAGGMGLTGVVVEATLRLLPVETTHMRVDTERASDLDDVMARMESGDAGYRYSVAWIDCLARGGSLGRSVLLRGHHARAEELGPDDRERPLELPETRSLPAPPWAPSGLLGRTTVRVFNELWFRRAPAEERGRLDSLESFFYPLDGVRDWNRLYGTRGFLQYQLALPFEAEATLREVLERLSRGGNGSFLAVIKRFGEGRGLLSFPIPGWTLALDMPADPEIAALLDGLDELVAAAGGRVYLAKDSRLRPELLPAMYPELDRWRELCARLDPSGSLRSDLSRRLALT